MGHLRKRSHSYWYKIHYNGKASWFNLGSDIILAKEVIKILEKSKRKEVVTKLILKLLENISLGLREQISELENLRIDKSLKEARKELANLRNLLRERVKGINYGN